MSETTEIERVELHRLRTGIESKRDSLRSHNGDLLRNRSVADKFSLDAVSRERYEQRECFAEWLDALLNAKGNDRAGKRARQSRSLRIRQAEETTMSGEAENTVRYREDERGEKLAQAVRGLQDFWRSGERDHHMYSPFTRQAAICADQLDAALRDYDSAAPQPASTWVEPYPDTHLVPETATDEDVQPASDSGNVKAPKKCSCGYRWPDPNCPVHGNVKARSRETHAYLPGDKGEGRCSCGAKWFQDESGWLKRHIVGPDELRCDMCGASEMEHGDSGCGGFFDAKGPQPPAQPALGPVGSESSEKPRCPWCNRNDFPNWSAAKLHVKFCEKAPRPRGRRLLRLV